MADIPKIVSNDRYQIVALADQATSTTPPEFRYWYANAPAWELVLMSDTLYPVFHTLDEFATYPDASLELPFRDSKVGQEWQIDGVVVEFYARPNAFVEATVTTSVTIGFTGRVEGISVPNWERTVLTTMTSGVVVSDEFSYSGTPAEQASDTWPNFRTAYLPVRMQGKVRAARILLSDIRLVAIRRVQLIGKMLPSRNP